MAISTPIIAMMVGLGFGLNLQSAILLSVLAFLGYAFVDDTDIVQTMSNLESTGKEVAEKCKR